MIMLLLKVTLLYIPECPISGQNSIVIVAGANLLLTEENVMAAEAVVKETKMVICQLEVSPQTTLAALKLAKKHKGNICLYFAKT